VLGGGKFETGAVTGAFGYLFNCFQHDCYNGRKSWTGLGPPPLIADANASVGRAAWDFWNNMSNTLVDAVTGIRDLIFSAPPLPGDLVGDQSDPRAGPNRNGGKHTSGPLVPAAGGTGGYQGDLDVLTGGTARPWQPGDKAPPGSQVGDNGIFGRPNSSGGYSIDIPANGKKPHETLHY
jgi:filamentous hemagglutinin